MSTARYHPASIVLHWLVFLLVIAAFIAIELKGQFPKGGEPRELCKQIHGVFGQLIFIAMAIRLFIRFRYGVPTPTNPIPLFTNLAKAMHWLLIRAAINFPNFRHFVFSICRQRDSLLLWFSMASICNPKRRV